MDVIIEVLGVILVAKVNNDTKEWVIQEVYSAAKDGTPVGSDLLPMLMFFHGPDGVPLARVLEFEVGRSGNKLFN